MKTLETRDKISEKLRGICIKNTNISAAMRPSISNLVPNQCLDIILFTLSSALKIVYINNNEFKLKQKK